MKMSFRVGKQSTNKSQPDFGICRYGRGLTLIRPKLTSIIVKASLLARSGRSLIAELAPIVERKLFKEIAHLNAFCRIH